MTAFFPAKTLLFLTALCAGTACAGPSDLVVYFSRAENAPTAETDGLTAVSLAAPGKVSSTGYLASVIGERLDAQVVSLKVQHPYPASFDATVTKNHEETGTFPALSSIPDLKDRQNIYLGFPIWNMAPPRALFTFLKEADFSGKNVYLFCTHDGYGSGQSLRMIRDALPNSTISGEVLAVDAKNLAESRTQATVWADKHALKAVSTGSADLTVSADGHEIQIRLNDTPEAQAFRKLLPLSVRMGEYGGREFYGPIDADIPTHSAGQYTFEDGTLTWCPTNDTVAIFYAQSARPRLSMAIYAMGKVISDLSVFESLPPSTVMEFREAK